MFELPKALAERGWGVQSYISTPSVERAVIKLRKTTDTLPPSEATIISATLGNDGWKLLSWFPTPDYHTVVLEKKVL